MVETLSYFSFWCNKCCGMYYPICGIVHIKESLLLIRKQCLFGSSRFPLSLSERSFTICPMPYNRIKVLSESLNKPFPSFVPFLKFNVCSIFMTSFECFPDLDDILNIKTVSKIS